MTATFGSLPPRVKFSSRYHFKRIYENHDISVLVSATAPSRIVRIDGIQMTGVQGNEKLKELGIKQGATFLPVQILNWILRDGEYTCERL